MGTELPSQSQEVEKEQKQREEVEEEEKNTEIRIRKGQEEDVYADTSRTRAVEEELGR